MSHLRAQVTAGAALGIGMGGFVDGILFHQILQLHNMLSAVVPRTTLLNEQVNMFWDGLFHAFTWTMTALGIFLLWRVSRRLASPPSGVHLLGAITLGWGLFNLIEGIIDHEILGIHHVYENGSHTLWDMVFLGSGVLFIALGGVAVRSRAGNRPDL